MVRLCFKASNYLRLHFLRINAQILDGLCHDFALHLTFLRIAKTAAERAELLTVLSVPEVPLHNNASELQGCG
jgi:hypothetical protein